VRLSPATLGRVPVGTKRFAYHRAAQRPGIVHFGIGAFHRAHQAWYTDRAMDAGDSDWGIVGVSLRSPAVAEQLNPQGGLYTVTERSAAGDSVRVVGAVQRVIVAGQDGGAVIDAIAAPFIAIVSFTVTEKGYCRATNGGLDFGLAEQRGMYRLLAQGLRRRHDQGHPGVTLLACDNLADNGPQLSALMTEYLERRDPTLVPWFTRECACPSTMIDRIVPATTDADRFAVSRALGVADDAAVVTEPFSQWIIEDRFAGSRPSWDAVGASIVSDVAPYETAKLRMLNGAHSALAYLGLERGHSFVHEAIADPKLRSLVSSLMRDEAMPTIDPAPGQNLSAYADELIERFSNPALNHRLAQIAMDGSQKIPQRWLATLAENQRRGRSCPALLAALAAWMRHVRGDDGAVDDPMTGELARLWSTLDLAGVARSIFGPGGLIVSDWKISAVDLATMATK